MTNEIKIAGFDVETNGTMFMVDGQDPSNDVASVQFYLSDTKQKLFFPLNMIGVTPEMKAKSLEWIGRIVDEYYLVGHNAAYDALQLMKLGISPTRIRIVGDSQVLAKMTQHRKYALKDMVVDWGIAPIEEVIKMKELVPDYDSTQVEFDNQEFIQYGVNDAYWAYILESTMIKKYISHTLTYEEELDNVVPFAYMQFKGMKIQYKEFCQYRENFNEQVAQTTLELNEIAGFEFNINSRKHKAQVLEERNLPDPPIRTAKGAVSYSIEAMTYLKGDEFVDKMLDSVRMYDVQGTLNKIEQYLPLNSAHSPRLHPEYRFVGEDGTSRVYTKNPSANSLPMEFREFIVPDQGNQYFYMDWSGAELMLAAYWAGETWLIDAYEAGEDIHKLISSRLLDKPISEITDEDRGISKIVVFSVMFGSEGGAASRAMKTSFEAGARLVDRFWVLCPNILNLKESLLSRALQTGYTRTITGRKRKISRLYSSDQTEVAKGKRQVFNTAIQSSVADLQKRFIRKAFNFQMTAPHWKEIRLMTTVFDSFTFEIPKGGVNTMFLTDLDAFSEFHADGKRIKFRFKYKLGSNYKEASN